ncbi:hypothetical protein Rhal01_02954 [Rubritalea halochordaticola]|uniref:Uncharacterized protein n=1 Tax=Rubritalea halochordaticola TaxID=714537 RepID=A0ABP9V267_9BACT
MIILIEASNDSAFAGMECDEVARGLKMATESIKSGEHYDQSYLNMLFGPTGSIQEISIDNGWGDEFLRLAEEFDGLNERR